MGDVDKTKEELLKDIAELRAELEELRASQQKTIQKERLHALGQMASGIVHDFNNTLTPILGASDFLISNPEMLDNKKETLILLGSMRTAGRDGKNMVKRLRSFYRPEDETGVAPIDINHMVEQVVLLTKPKWTLAQSQGAAIDVATELGQIPSVLMNETHIREMLTNLILNAIDAMPEGGEVTVRTGVDDDCVIVEVSDTGKGMSEEIRQHCFEPFYSTKGRDGTGLGLAMVYGVVQKYEGAITVESEEGSGTTVRAVFHACAGDPGEKIEIVSGMKPVRMLKVLVVDDDGPSLEIISKCLEMDGHTVDNASNGTDAIEKCKKTNYDVVLLDVVMPDISGIELAGKVKATLPETPILLVTGSADFAEGACPDAADIVIDKPVTQGELRQAIAKVMTGKIR